MLALLGGNLIARGQWSKSERIRGLGFKRVVGTLPPIAENQIEKSMEHEMENGIIVGLRFEV